MQRLLRLCLWQAIIIGILTAYFPVSAEEERGIRMLGPKSSDVFPYERYGPITSKDTLWNIATRVRPDNRLTVYQVMQALYQENPQAFSDSNINHLVEGEYLKIPSFNNMMAINTNSAKQKSERDRKAWQQSQTRIVKKEVIKEPTVKKEDLDTVKTEINDQLQKIDGQQQERLDNIQNDISDSIDGLQAILKENDDLRQRLNSFNEKLGVMQDEVAKGKEIKLQMDDMIKLQQALLAKAEAREKQLLLEKQQAELDKQDITASLWFTIVMGTLPAILILALIAFLFKRRQQASDEVFFDELNNKKQVPVAKTEREAEELPLDELSLTEELDLDDELSLDDELTLDDELSLVDELGLDDDQLLDDNVIHLDEDDGLDDLDDLDDLEDILLDDDTEGDVLEGGELNQGDLDSLLSGLDDDTSSSEEESEILEGGELNQDDLNDLLGGLDNSNTEEPEPSLEEATDVTEPDDIDALLAQAAQPAPEKTPEVLAEAPLAEQSAGESVDVTDPDDIDALLAQAAQPASEETPEVLAEAPLAEESAEESVDVTDPDDIDALLAQAAQPASEETQELVAEAPLAEESAEESVDVTDPDDIDALLAQSAQPASEETPEALAEAPLAEQSAEESVDVTDPDDIDALLAQAAPEKTPEVVTEAPLAEESVEESVDVTDPDDIDALLAQAAQSAPEKTPEVVAEAPLAEESAEESVDVTDPDDIDALLAQAAQSAPEKTQEVVAEESVEESVDVTDPDDIDALLAQSAPEKTAEVVTEAPLAEKSVEESVDVTDPDDIDALLDSVAGSASVIPASANVENNQTTDEITAAPVNAEENIVSGEEQRIQDEIAENEAKIAEFTAEYVTPFLTADFSEILAKEQQSDLAAEDLTVNDVSVSTVNELDDEFDIDALITQNQPDESLSDDEIIEDDIGDSLTEVGNIPSQELNDSINEQATERNVEQDDSSVENKIELAPDFSNEEVLAELLNESGLSDEIHEEKVETPLDVIEELDDVDFDELLANIEEETATYPTEEENKYEFEDIGDDLIESSPSVESALDSEGVVSSGNYVSVDDLLSDSFEETDASEPYEKTNIDVGLGQFAENETGVDVDEDGSISSKIDLAKMYIEMSDEENAQVILQEVIEKGDDAQQAEAQTLLDAL